MNRQIDYYSREISSYYSPIFFGNREEVLNRVISLDFFLSGEYEDRNERIPDKRNIKYALVWAMESGMTENRFFPFEETDDVQKYLLKMCTKYIKGDIECNDVLRRIVREKLGEPKQLEKLT